jgi:hypothetical protein
MRTTPCRRSGLMWCLLVAALLSLQGACLSKWRYEKLRKQDSIEAYEAYLKDHTHDKYTAQVQARLEELCFERAEEEGTYAAYTEFLERFPRGRHAAAAEAMAEDIRAREGGIRLCRDLPEDYYATLSGTELPFRILVKAIDHGAQKEKTEMRWFEEFKRRDALVPLDPRKSYAVRPDLTLEVTESSVTLCRRPLPSVEARLWAGPTMIKVYKVAGAYFQQCVLYGLLKDQETIGTHFRVSKRKVETVEARFAQVLSELPLRGALSLEYDPDPAGSDWDRTMLRDFAAFLQKYPLCEDMLVYRRGSPPSRALGHHRAFLRVDPDIHAPVFSIGARFQNDLPHWSAWNSKRILLQKDFFFKKMLLDILESLLMRGVLSHSGGT